MSKEQEILTALTLLLQEACESGVLPKLSERFKQWAKDNKPAAVELSASAIDWLVDHVICQLVSGA